MPSKADTLDAPVLRGLDLESLLNATWELLEDGVARMRKLPELVIDDGETVTFERGGKHLMLMRPVDTPDAVTLSLYSGETLVVSVETPVRREP